MMALSGVRSSCDMLARNCDLALLAASAATCATWSASLLILISSNCCNATLLLASRLSRNSRKRLPKRQKPLSAKEITAGTWTYSQARSGFSPGLTGKNVIKYFWRPKSQPNRLPEIALPLEYIPHETHKLEIPIKINNILIQTNNTKNR